MFFGIADKYFQARVVEGVPLNVGKAFLEAVWEWLVGANERDTCLGKVFQSTAVSLEVVIDLEPAVALFQALKLREEWDVFLGVLLGQLGHHQHQLEIIHAQSHIEQLVHVGQENGILERLLGKSRVGICRELKSEAGVPLISLSSLRMASRLGGSWRA